MNYCTTSYRRSKLDSQYEYTSTEYANKNAQSDDVAAEQLVQSPLFQRLRIGVGAETPADIFQPVENIQAIGNLSAK